MMINITGKHLSLGRKLKDYIQSSIQTMDSKFYLDSPHCSVILSKDNNNVKANIALQLHRGQIIRTDSISTRTYDAIHDALNHLSLKLRKYKSKLKGIKRHRLHHKQPEILEE